MRIIRTKLHPNTCKVLADYAEQQFIEDPGFAEDLFVLLVRKGSGIPTQEQIEKHAEKVSKETKAPYGLTLTAMKHRAHIYSTITGLPLFKAISLAAASNPFSGMQSLLRILKKLMVKRQQAKCLSCPLLKGGPCDFGLRYSVTVTDISLVRDTNWATLVHQDCPVRGQIEGINAVASAASSLAAMSNGQASTQAKASGIHPGAYSQFTKMEEEVEEEAETPSQDDGDDDDFEDFSDLSDDASFMLDEGSNHGGGDMHGLPSCSGRTFAMAQEQFIEKLSLLSFQLYELGATLDTMLGKEVSGKFSPTSTPSERKHGDNIKTASEVLHAQSSQHALDNDSFDAKAARKELIVDRNMTPSSKRKMLYLLIDSSLSMSYRVCENGNFLLSRGQVASTFGASLVRRVVRDKGIIALRFFAGSVTGRIDATDNNTSDIAQQAIIDCDYKGGGTRPAAALNAALEDIEKAKDVISKSEVLMITDMDCTIDKQQRELIEKALKKQGVKFHCLNVNTADEATFQGNGHIVLRELATRYMQIDPKQVDPAKLVSLIK